MISVKKTSIEISAGLGVSSADFVNKTNMLEDAINIIYYIRWDINIVCHVDWTRRLAIIR